MLTCATAAIRSPVPLLSLAIHERENLVVAGTELTSYESHIMYWYALSLLHMYIAETSAQGHPKLLISIVHPFFDSLGRYHPPSVLTDDFDILTLGIPNSNIDQPDTSPPSPLGVDGRPRRADEPERVGRRRSVLRRGSAERKRRESRVVLGGYRGWEAEKAGRQGLGEE